jgi:hypothetical protein
VGRTAALLGAVVLLASCFGPDPNLTESGEARPQIRIRFPDIVEAKTVETAVLTVENPGPGDIPTLVVAFALVGPGKGQRLPPSPLIGFGRRGANPSIVATTPEPMGVSANGSVYTFGTEGASPRPILPAGESMTIEFRIRTPVVTGVAANSVTVYDGTDVNRVRGIRLEARVR